MPQHYLAMDCSDVLAKFNTLKATIANRDVTNRILHDTIVDTAKKTTTILARTIPKQYDVKQSFVRAGVMKYQDQSVGGNINIAVPLSGHRGTIGGTFKKRGRAGRPKRGRKYKISAKILKGQYSALPDTMEHQGGNPPFVGKNLVFTRKYKTSAYPIVRVVGLGLPQMPLNQSKDEVSEQIITYMGQRLEHHFQRYIPFTR